MIARLTYTLRPISSHFLFPVFQLFLVFLFSTFQLAAQTENCTNGLDDDADGLVDCYDQDCTCTGQCDDFYYTTCNADCYYIPPCDSIQLGVQWTGEANLNTYSVFVAGDIDRDGVPDVVSYRCEFPDIYVADGATGATKLHIVGPTKYPGGTSPALADLDKDGFGEILLVGEDRILRCWDHLGNLKWASTIQMGYGFRYQYSSPNVADFDHDGWPEVNVGNQVFNGQTGALLAEGGPDLSAGEHPARKANGFSFNAPVPIDALPDGFCPDCEGLEIVAGNQVMSVNLQTGVVTAIRSAPAAYSDGFTSVVDFDRDGDLDAVVQGRKGQQNTCYVWDLQSGQVIREYALVNNWYDGASRVNVADLDGDGQLEVSFVGYPWLYCLENDFSLKWRLFTDDASSVTGSSVFDFCGDGSSDVVYRGSTFLQIIEGATGKVKWQDACVSATHIENPLILDVDADGQTEVVISCKLGIPDGGKLVCYEAVGLPGIASRRVWNQHAYFNVNINDDLSVPRYQQNPHLVGNGLTLNTFQNQYFNPTFPSPDGVLTLQNVSCAGDSLVVRGTICNPGDNVLPQFTPISFYKHNPTTAAAEWVGMLPLGFDVAPNDCESITFKIPRLANDSIFAVLNDDHSKLPPLDFTADFPVTSIGECGFANNMAGFRYNYNPTQIDFGSPDTTVCDNATVPLSAVGNDLISWVWSDGSTLPAFIAPDAGIYAVTVTDRCGLTQTDEIQVFIDSSTVVQIGPDREMCEGEALVFAESGFDFYSWSPAGVVNCPTCPTVAATPAQSGLIMLEASFANGCRSRDTAFVMVRDTFYRTIDTTICYGLSVRWNGADILPDQERVFKFQTVHGCDSTERVRVRGTSVGTYFHKVDTAICLGKYLPYGAAVLPPDSTHVFYLSAKTGCDSTVVVEVFPKDTFATAQQLVICGGATASIFGQDVSASGIYRKTFTARNGCDSTHTIDLLVLPQITLAVDGTPTCLNEMTGTMTAAPGGGVPPFRFEWNLPNETAATLTDLPAGNYAVTVTDAADCTKTAGGEVPNFPPIVFEVETDSVRCWGEANGEIRAIATDATLMFSLDGGETWAQQTVFGNLPASPYTLQAQDVHGCIETAPAPIFQPDPLVLALPPDQTIQLGDSALLAVQTNSLQPLTYQWSTTEFLTCTDCPFPYSKAWNSIRYSLTVRDPNGCTATDEIMLEVRRVVDVFVPNVFSPSARDDQNTRLLPQFGPAVGKIRSFRVFDRWGAMLHEVRNVLPNDLAGAWDGRRPAGKIATAGVYVWAMEVELVDGTVQQFDGDVTVF